jgi:tRNA A37 methylthiotransferase MiaB
MGFSFKPEIYFTTLNRTVLSDDGLVVKTCKVYSIAHTRTLRLLGEMVETKHKTVIEVTAMADTLIKDRGKHISPKVLTDWTASLEKYRTS